MSNCIKELNDYDLVKKCCRCKLNCLKSVMSSTKLLVLGANPATSGKQPAT